MRLIALILILLISVAEASSASPLTYTDTSGKSQNLPSDMIIVEIFATWCDNCQDQHPDLLEAHNAYPDVPLYSLSPSPQDSISDVLTYNESFPSPWVLGMDVGGTIKKSYSVDGYPTFLVLDGSELRACLLGVQEKSTLFDLFRLVNSGSDVSEFPSNCSTSDPLILLLWGVTGSVLVAVILFRRKKGKTS